jgi:hypothetical protein
LRGIRPDGTFYGEIRKFHPGGIIIDVEGKLSKEDLIEFHRLVDEIRQIPFDPSLHVSCIGVLGEGPLHKPNILYRYLEENRKDTHADKCFEGLIEILIPYMEKFYDNLK